ncbi:peptidylprolyl isomerase [Salibacterium salarium]|uniref:peptidylprolyl isomerase n=1 Tax=Salibacterium salarium TaxID=284579 RepID=A0A3R9P5X0_9BACI|nr:SurA N-terminal domain-containing protein [Salibacterium salarium]RSL31895.1 peptidylprolyl isomerase [Salibacterium salarium]
MLSKKWLLSLSLAVSVSVIAACGGGDESAGEENNNEGQGTQEEESEQGSEEGNGENASEGEGSSNSESDSNSGENAGQAEMPEPDVEDIPDVVAEVNGEEISGEEFKTSYEGQFQQAAMQSQMTGEEVDQDQLKQQLAESMVGTELLMQEADNREIEAAQEDIDSTLDDLVSQNDLESKDELISTLEEQQGMSEEEIMSQVETQVKVDQLIAEEAGDTEPTEEELQEAYEQVKTQQEQMGGQNGEDTEVPSFEEMKPDLKEQVISQKEADASQTLVENLRESADVTINL